MEPVIHSGRKYILKIATAQNETVAQIVVQEKEYLVWAGETE